MDRPFLEFDYKKVQVFDLLTAAGLKSMPTKLSGNAQRKIVAIFKNDLTKDDSRMRMF